MKYVGFDGLVGRSAKMYRDNLLEEVLSYFSDDLVLIDISSCEDIVCMVGWENKTIQDILTIGEKHFEQYCKICKQEDSLQSIYKSFLKRFCKI